MKDKSDNSIDDKSILPDKEPKNEQTEEQKHALMETKKLKSTPGVIDAYVEEQ